MQEADEACQLLPLQVGGVLVLMLLHSHVAATALLRAQLADSMLSVLQPLSAVIMDEVSAAKGRHLKGFRQTTLRPPSHPISHLHLLALHALQGKYVYSYCVYHSTAIMEPNNHCGRNSNNYPNSRADVQAEGLAQNMLSKHTDSEHQNSHSPGSSR